MRGVGEEGSAADFAALIVMEVIGLWSWQTYHTARFSPFPRIPSYLPLVWRFLFYIITDNALTHTHIQRETQTLSQPQLL